MLQGERGDPLAQMLLDDQVTEEGVFAIRFSNMEVSDIDKTVLLECCR
jgi:hypothetical protein